MPKPEVMKVVVTGTLQDANGNNATKSCNLIEFCSTQSPYPVVATSHTTNPPDWDPVSLAATYYRVRVNRSCWGTPDPLRVYSGMPKPKVRASCTDQC